MSQFRAPMEEETTFEATQIEPYRLFQRLSEVFLSAVIFYLFIIYQRSMKSFHTILTHNFLPTWAKLSFVLAFWQLKTNKSNLKYTETSNIEHPPSFHAKTSRGFLASALSTRNFCQIKFVPRPKIFFPAIQFSFCWWLGLNFSESHGYERRGPELSVLTATIDTVVFLRVLCTLSKLIPTSCDVT